jgi:hypothetical protein
LGSHSRCQYIHCAGSPLAFEFVSLFSIFIFIFIFIFIALCFLLLRLTTNPFGNVSQMRQNTRDFANVTTVKYPMVTLTNLARVRYEVRIIAANNFGIACIANASTSVITPNMPTPPPPPVLEIRKLLLSNDSNAVDALLAWNMVPEASSYVVEFREFDSVGFNDWHIVTSTKLPTATITGILVGTLVQFQVRAANAFGTASTGTTVEVLASIHAPTVGISNLVVESLSPTGAVLRWDPVATAHLYKVCVLP